MSMLATTSISGMVVKPVRWLLVVTLIAVAATAAAAAGPSQPKVVRTFHAQGNLVAVARGSLWLLRPGKYGRRARLARINMQTGMTQGLTSVGSQPIPVVASGDSVWVGNAHGDASQPQVDAGTLQRIEATSGRTRALIRLGVDPALLVATNQTVWVVPYGSPLEVLRLDVRTGRVTVRRKLVLKQPSLQGFARTRGRLWLSVSVPQAGTPPSTQLLELDPRTLAVRRSLKRRGSAYLSSTGTQLWLCSSGPPTLRELDPVHGSLSTAVRLLHTCQVAGGREAAWLVGYDHVYGFNAETHEFERRGVGIGAIHGIAADGSTLWVSAGGNRLLALRR